MTRPASRSSAGICARPRLVTVLRGNDNKGHHERGCDSRSANLEQQKSDLFACQKQTFVLYDWQSPDRAASRLYLY
jgi:hypothetical protein